MKSYLFIDTAEGTRALLKAGNEYYYDENLKNSGSETLMPMIDKLLAAAGIKIAGVELFGACVGPGSFTGLRIGLTTIKAFCYGLSRQCFAVNNLRLNSYNNNSDKVISIADAGNKVCYIAAYDGDNEIEASHCVTIEYAREYVAAHPDYAVSTDIKLSGLFPTAVAGVGKRELTIAAERALSNPIDYKELLPLYIRKAQPERGEGDL